MVSIVDIKPNPLQPRVKFDDAKLDELAASIRQKGILQPIILRKNGSQFEIVAGERRWRACQKAGLHEIPATIHDFDELEMMQAALIENIQRDDLGAIEEARAFERLISHFGITQEQVAESVGKSRVSVTNALRLLRLPSEVLDLIHEGKLTAGHARTLLSLDSEERQIEFANEIVEKGMNVRKSEALAKKYRNAGSKPETPKAEVDSSLADLEEKITECLGLKIKISAGSNASGKIEVFYATLDEFEGFCEKIGVSTED